jgi:hypothetical protein
MRNASWIALLVVAVAGSAGAQAGSIDSGMTKDQVVARLGKPISEQSSGGSTYLYYSNGDEKKYGMHDMVALENGKVVDAVFRSSARHYTGKSSSPAAVAPEDAAAKGHGGRPMKPAPVEKKAAPPMKKEAPPMKKEPAPPAKKAEVPAKTGAPVKTAPAPKTPPATKAVPPTGRLSEPKQGVDTRKIEPAKKSPDATKKSSDTTKKATPAPTKKP